MKLGFIGLGIMGKPMAKNLIKAGHELVVCDIVKEAVTEIAALGAKPAANPAEVAATRDIRAKTAIGSGGCTPAVRASTSAAAARQAARAAYAE